MRRRVTTIALMLFGAAASLTAAEAGRQAERLGRGVVAVRRDDGSVFVSWRLLASDPAGVAFDLYCAVGDGGAVRLNDAPLDGATCFVDRGADPFRPSSYHVRPVVAGEEQEPGAAFALPEGLPTPYLAVPLRTPAGYAPNDASVGDLDDDGEYEVVLHQAGRGRDNSQDGSTDPPVLQAYKLDGTFLWQIDLGRNVREGAHYTQFLVYDFDGDGRAEVACKTADGTVDGTGSPIGDPTADHRNRRGRVLDGPEDLTVFDGLTGAALATADYVPPRGDVSAWGDDYGNRADRFLACVAYLDGMRPSLVFCRGYYTRTVLAAWDWRDGQMTRRWTFDSDAPGNEAYAGQGNHSVSVADLDADGRDEIVYGACVIDDDGGGLYSTGLGHGDAQHTSDLDPDRPGLETFSVHEKVRHRYGFEMRDARTGEILWGRPSRDVGRGLAADIDPRHPGAECWAAGFDVLFDRRGNEIGPRPRSCNMAVWWDGDPQRELLSGTSVAKWDHEAGREFPLLDARAHGCAAINGSKATPCLVADLFGDWREEVIWRSADNAELRIFTTPIPTPHRMTTLMHDPTYRLGVAWQNVGYNQPPHLGFSLADRLRVTADVP